MAVNNSPSVKCSLLIFFLSEEMMLKLEIPGWRDLTLEYLVLDYNGTLPITGELIPAVPDLFPGNPFQRLLFSRG